MAVLGLREAARAAGVSRQTIYRKAKDGELSTVTRDDGSRGVDTSELLRVFGTVRDAETVPSKSQGQSHGTESDRELQAARQRIQELETRLAEEQAARAREQDAAADRERWLREKIDQTTRLLEHKPDPAPPVATIDPADLEGASKKKLRKLLKRLLGG